MVEEQPSPHLGAPRLPPATPHRPGHRPLQASQGAPYGSRAAAVEQVPPSRSPAMGFKGRTRTRHIARPGCGELGAGHSPPLGHR